MKRTYHVERLFELGSYKNIKFAAGVEIDESDTRDGGDVFRQLVDEIYRAFFDHNRRLENTKDAQTISDKETLFFKE